MSLNGDTPAGWYPDPRGTPRWWNGLRWTADETDDAPARPGTDGTGARAVAPLAIVALVVSIVIGGCGTAVGLWILAMLVFFPR